MSNATKKKHNLQKNTIYLTLTEAIEQVGAAGLLGCFLPAPGRALSASLSSLLVLSDGGAGGAGGGVSPGQIL